MKSQYIFLFFLAIFTILFYSLSNLKLEYNYSFDLYKYLLEDFRAKILIYNNTDLVDTINETYYLLCLEYKIICFYNKSHIILNDGEREKILEIG